MSLPILPHGTLVKPQVSGLLFHWLQVLHDPGPASDRKRRIVLARTEPERRNERLLLRRDRVHTDASRLSVWDVVPTPGEVRATAAAARTERASFEDPGDIPEFLRRPL